MEPGNIYRHYKGGIYEIVAIAKDSETVQLMVIYKNVMTGDHWVRPFAMFNENVEVAGTKVPRFELIED